jgi:hypothetical protein
MKNLFLLLLTLAFAVACGSNNKNTNSRIKDLEVSTDAKIALADKDSDEKVICRQVKKIGSNRITTVCRSESEMEELRERTQAELRRGAQSGPSGQGKGGN